jgi:hypothetical protein
LILGCLKLHHVLVVEGSSVEGRWSFGHLSVA